MTGGWPTAGLVLGTGGVYATAVHGSTVDSFYNQIQQGQQTLPGPSSMPFQGVYRRGLIVVDIQRVTSFRYTAYLYYDASLSAFCDITYKTMMDACDQPFLTNLTNLAGYNLQTNAMVAMTYSNFLGQVTTQAYTDSAGPLNCVNIAWNMSTISMTIWAVAVARFQ
jgi:hypothetical protein